jgi:hypothetical protein
LTNWENHFIYWAGYNRTLLISVVFTWELPEIERRFCKQRWIEFDRILIGGPAIRLLPNYFEKYPFVQIGGDLPFAFKMHNADATRSSTGCIRHCKYCGVDKIEGRFRLLKEFAPGNVLIDNNVTALPIWHFHKIMDHLDKHSTKEKPADIQGVDVRLLNREHAERLHRSSVQVLRIALDSMSYVDEWNQGVSILRRAGIAKNRIRSYALVGFDSDPGEAWQRCEYIESKGIKPLPMFYRPLDILEKNQITEDQAKLGWNDYERRRIMQWFYKHKKAVKGER